MSVRGRLLRSHRGNLLGLPRSRAHLARRQELASLRGKREDERLNFLRHVTEVGIEIDDLKITISALDGLDNGSPELERMLTWSKQRLEKLSASISGASLSAELIDKKLFTEPDHLNDPEGDSRLAF